MKRNPYVFIACFICAASILLHGQGSSLVGGGGGTNPHRDKIPLSLIDISDAGPSETVPGIKNGVLQWIELTTYGDAYLDKDQTFWGTNTFARWTLMTDVTYGTTNTLCIGSNLVGVASNRSKVAIYGATGVSTNYPLLKIVSPIGHNSNAVEVLGNAGVTTNFYIDRTGNVNIGPFDYVATNLVFGATTTLGQVVTNTVLVPSAVVGAPMILGLPADTPNDSVFHARCISAGTAQVYRTCIVAGGAYTNTFTITPL